MSLLLLRSGAVGPGAALAAAASSTSNATAALTTSIRLAAAASSTSNATAALTTAIRLAAAAHSASAASAALTTAIRLAAAASSTSNATATLTASSGSGLAAAASSTSNATATLTTAIRLAAAASSASAASADLTTSIELAAAASSASAASADLTTSIRLAAAASSTSNATATLASVPPNLIGAAAPLTVSLDPRTKAVYQAAAADAYRALIQPVPGAGPVLGVVAMAFAGVDQVYAFRGNAGLSAVLLWRASPSGWVRVPYYNLLEFSHGGAAEPFDGETLTQGSVSAIIKRVHWEAGAWATAPGAGSASGLFIVADPLTGNFVAGPAVTSGGATVTLAGPQSPITMAAGGRFEFDKANFSGQLVTRRVYGADGVNRAFSFDGETLAPIRTGLTLDRPQYIRAHKGYLFLAYQASLLYSAPGDPTKWNSVDGGGEIACGDTVTGMITLPGSQTTAALCVFMRTNSAFLYGLSPSTFNFVAFNTGVGAVPYSAQNLFDTFFLDDLGAVTLKTTLNYGNFLPTTLTKNILPFIARQRGHLVASSINREKSQYRLYFADGYALMLTVLNQNYLGAGLALYRDAIACVDSTKLLGDDEATYAGAQSGGCVYQLDRGTSFDGGDIDAYFKTAWDAVKSPRIKKHFRAASIEVQGDTYTEIQFGYQLGYSSSQIAQPPSIPLVLNLGAVPHWDEFTWDEFTWDSVVGLTPTDVDVTGDDAENIQVTISSGSNFIGAYTVDSIIHHYSLRRGIRA